MRRQQAMSYAQAVPRLRRSPYMVGLICTLALAGTTAWIHFQPTDEERELIRQEASTATLQDISWPSDFTPVDSADGCITGPGAICLATDLAPAEAAAVVAQVISTPASSIELRSGLPGAPEGSRVMSGSYKSQPVSAAIDAHRLTSAEVSPARFSGGSTISLGTSAD